MDGRLTAFLRRRSPDIRVFPPESEPERTRVAVELYRVLAQVAHRRQSSREGLLIGRLNGEPARDRFLSRYLVAAGFVDTAAGHQMRRMVASMGSVEPA